MSGEEVSTYCDTWGVGGGEKGRGANGWVGPMKFVVVVPMGEETVKGRGFGEVLGESLRKLGLEGAGLSTLVRYDFSPTGQPPRQPEVQKGVLFIGREYLAIVSVSLVLALIG